MYDIFISYSRKDFETVDTLCKFLLENKISFWLDKKDIPLAEAFPAHIVHAIENSKIIVFVASQNSKNSSYVCREVKYALDFGKIVIPFKIDDETYNDNLKLYFDIYNHFPAFPPPVSQYLQEFISKLQNILFQNHNATKPFLKQITDINDFDLEALLTIYKARFLSENNVSEEFIINNLFVDDENHKSFLFVLKKLNRIVGIADVSYFVKEKILFVSYIATYNIKQKGDEIILSYNIFDGLLKHFTESKQEVREIIFETEDIKIFRFFSRLVKHQLKVNTYRIDCNYYQPKVLSDNDVGVTNEIPLILGYIPMSNKQNISSLPKNKVIEIIELIYYNIYFDITDLTLEEHNLYLQKLVEQYKLNTNEQINLLNY